MRDQVVPNGPWRFGEDVTAAFDDMLARSIPQYESMRGLVSTLAATRLCDGAVVLDLGCSRGEALARLRELAVSKGHACRYIGVETSAPMLGAARERFVDCPDVEIRDVDLRRGVPAERGLSVVLSVLTLQFVPVEYRHAIVRSCFEALRPGGMMVLVEKILGGGAEHADLFSQTYHAMKQSNGYSPEAVEAKRVALEGVLVPLTARGNEEMLDRAGFDAERFWQWCNFAGWIAIRR